jgi:hypothetical protein
LADSLSMKDKWFRENKLKIISIVKEEREYENTK